MFPSLLYTFHYYCRPRLVHESLYPPSAHASSTDKPTPPSPPISSAGRSMASVHLSRTPKSSLQFFSGVTLKATIPADRLNYTTSPPFPQSLSAKRSLTADVVNSPKSYSESVPLQCGSDPTIAAKRSSHVYTPVRLTPPPRPVFARSVQNR